MELTAVSMTAHRQRMHGTETEIDLNRFPDSHMEHIPQVFDVTLPRSTSQFPCPLPGYLGYSHTCNGLWNHFNHQNWGDSLQILEDHPTPSPKCKRCGSQVTPWHLGNRHYESYKLWLGEECRIIRTTLQHCFEASWVPISVNTDPLVLVAAFPYLGRTVAYNNSDWASLYQNICKA